MTPLELTEAVRRFVADNLPGRTAEAVRQKS